MKNTVRKDLFYDGSKLLSMRDLNGNKPTFYMVCSNRTAGKTTFFSRYLTQRWLDYGEKPCILYRFKQDIEDVAGKFFGDIQTLFFQNYHMTEQVKNKGAYLELSIHDDVLEESYPFGYAVSINAADSVKKVSHILNDSATLFFDEFQSETDNYAPRELEKFQSVYTSIARGGGKQFRELPVIMCSNNVSLLNPYFTAFGVSDRLRPDTKFLRGNGWVLEIAQNEGARSALEESGFYRAFGCTDYMRYAARGHYLNDNNSFVEKPTTLGHYLYTIAVDGKEYGVSEHPEEGIIYVSDKADKTFPVKFSATLPDHTINYVMLSNNRVHINYLRGLFEKGCFRFKNLRCKQAILKALAYYG